MSTRETRPTGGNVGVARAGQMTCIACKALLVPILARLGSLLCHECKYDGTSDVRRVGQAIPTDR
jgi:hypothetical protein